MTHSFDSRVLLAVGLAAAVFAAPVALGQSQAAPQAPGPGGGHPGRIHRMELPRLDLNSDGYISREEARTMAETMFAHLDTNKDGKLDPTDRPHRRHRIELHSAPEERREHHEETSDGKRIERVEIHRIERGGGHRKGGRGHHMHGAPMGMMLMMSHDEADTNNDGSLSKAEFVTLHQRFFDAADVNGDGRIKFEPPPLRDGAEPPLPPAPVPPPRR